MDVVKTEAAFHTQAVVVGGAITAFHTDNLVVLHVVSQQAAHAAEGADRIHFFIHHLGTYLRLRHQGTRRASLHTFATSHARAIAHLVIQIKHDLAVCAAMGIANHIVHLFFAAGTHTAIALDTRIEVHRHRGVRHIAGGLLAAQGF